MEGHLLHEQARGAPRIFNLHAATPHIKKILLQGWCIKCMGVP